MRLLIILGLLISPLALANVCFDTYRLSNYERAVEPGVLVAASGTAPAHCVVRGVINRAIRFEVRLPVEGWNGRFLMMGTGGSSGYIADTTQDLHRGYAISSTDTGHVGSDVDFATQPEAALDYAFRAVHLAALTSKDVIQQYYGRDIRYSYYEGCSNGGRQGLIEATRYPEDFDGIVAGAPLFQIMNEFMLWSLHVNRAQMAHPLSDVHLQLLDRASSAACDALDGVVDGVINDPRQCTLEHFDPADLVCQTGQADDTCLTEEQLQTVMAHYEGVVDAQGNVLSPGLLPGAEGAGDWKMWALPGNQIPTTGETIETSRNAIVSDLLKVWVYQDPAYDHNDFDIYADRGDLARASAVLDVNSADLRKLRARGGKVLMYQGWNDYPLRPQRAINYLHAVESSIGDERKTRDFFQLFMVPGMLHCGGGPGAWDVDYLEPLVNWVEKGVRPEKLTGSRPDGKFTRTHCPYPQIAQFSEGDPDQAASYRCSN